MGAAFAILAAVLLVGCHESGTWSDDAKNFHRIFRVSKPDDVNVVHSWFWRSPHFTYEYEYYIQLQKHADMERRLLTMNPMMQLTGDLEKAAALGQSKPTWFIPKPIIQYDVWTYSNRPNDHFLLFRDRETGDLFLADHLR
jgi:hypothetical protein